MDEFRENGRLRGALDASLSGLNGDLFGVVKGSIESESVPSALCLPSSPCWPQ